MSNTTRAIRIDDKSFRGALISLPSNSPALPRAAFERLYQRHFGCPPPPTVYTAPEHTAEMVRGAMAAFCDAVMSEASTLDGQWAHGYVLTDEPGPLAWTRYCAP